MTHYLNHTAVAKKLLDQQGEINDLRAALARVTTVRDTWRDHCIHWQTGWLLGELSAAIDGTPAPERAGTRHSTEHCRDAAALARVRAECDRIDAEIRDRYDQDNDGMHKAVRRIRATLDRSQP